MRACNLICISSVLFPLCAFTQAPVKYEVFKRTPLSQLEIRLPEPAAFQQVSTTNNTNLFQPPGINLSNNLNQISGFNPQAQNQKAIQEANTYIDRQNEKEINKMLMEEAFYRKHVEWLAKARPYTDAFERLSQLNPDSFSITKAVYIVENAWLENKYSYADFEKRMQFEASVIRQQLKNEKLDINDNTALNYGIQRRFRLSTSYFDSRKKQTFTVKPFKYDFEDYMGEKDYKQMFVTKLLLTGKGQCHSLPLLYLMMAEQLGAKAWLSLAPEHSFVRFMDKNGNLLNYETTNGNLVSDNWLNQSGYINAVALKNKIYLDTLSQRELYAQCLGDLLLGYLKKFDYDGFAETMRQRILQLNPHNMTALMIDANIKRLMALQQIRAAGSPKEKDLQQYPEAYAAYMSMQAAFDKVDGMGFQDMPPEAYQRWLQSLGQAKKKQESKELQERMQRELEYLKKIRPKSVIIDRTRG